MCGLAAEYGSVSTEAAIYIASYVLAILGLMWSRIRGQVLSVFVP
jgi:uncharacterized membrane protein YjjB (DUF3815 family)